MIFSYWVDWVGVGWLGVIFFLKPFYIGVVRCEEEERFHVEMGAKTEGMLGW